ncbi:HIT family protein [Robiginitalea sp. IMCC43444]|uniref:HIT family protein n=1 Tax=Robiginitalea sp. IMCC43444 TaxID=3459121 RepID=UPI004040F146
MPSIFTRIINGEIPCYKIAEDADNFAFLDINPNSKGHTLCIPKNEVDKITDMDPGAYESLMRFSRKIAIALDASIDCLRVGMTVIGLEVPHVHVHLIPLQTMADATFQKKEQLSPEEFEAIAAKIRSNL